MTNYGLRNDYSLMRVTVKARDKGTTIKEDLKNLQAAFGEIVEDFDIQKVETWNGRKWIELE